MLGENVLANISPAGMISLRLANPVQSLLFDRVPRVAKDARGTEGITSQSSGKLITIKLILAPKLSLN